MFGVKRVDRSHQVKQLGSLLQWYSAIFFFPCDCFLFIRKRLETIQECVVLQKIKRKIIKPMKLEKAKTFYSGKWPKKISNGSYLCLARVP